MFLTTLCFIILHLLPFVLGDSHSENMVKPNVLAQSNRLHGPGHNGAFLPYFYPFPPIVFLLYPPYYPSPYFESVGAKIEEWAPIMYSGMNADLKTILSLDNEGFHVFAPSDDAILRFLDEYGADNIDDALLEEIILHHIVLCHDFSDLEEVLSPGVMMVSLSGKPLRVYNANDGLTVEGSKILKYKECRNGKVYLMDSVIFPFERIPNEST